MPPPPPPPSLLLLLHVFACPQEGTEEDIEKTIAFWLLAWQWQWWIIIAVQLLTRRKRTIDPMDPRGTNHDDMPNVSSTIQHWWIYPETRRVELKFWSLNKPRWAERETNRMNHKRPRELLSNGRHQRHRCVGASHLPAAASSSKAQGTSYSSLSVGRSVGRVVGKVLLKDSSISRTCPCAITKEKGEEERWKWRKRSVRLNKEGCQAKKTK